MFFSFLLFGVIITVMIWIIQRRKPHPMVKFITIIFFIALLGFIFLLFRSHTFLSNTSWYNQTPFKEIILFFMMLFGMMARYITKVIEDRREKIQSLKNSKQKFEKPKLNFDLLEFSYPLFFSVITFSSLLSQVETQEIQMSILMLSFQMGFFWQTLLKKEIK